MNNKDLSIGRSLQYSLGNVATNVLFIFIGTYLMFFYTDILGFSGTVAGTIFMTARIVDALTDPIMGMIIDRTNSKRFGKFMPYILFATPFMAIFFVLMFAVPQMDMGARVAYSYITYILYSLAWTVVQTPYLAMPIILSPDVNKRTRLTAIIQGVGGLGIMFGSALAIPLLNSFGGQTNEGSWKMVGLVLAAIFVTLMYISIIGFGKYDKYQPPVLDADQKPAPKPTIKHQMKAVFKNAPLILIIIGFATDSFAMQIGGALNMYFFRYNMGGRTDLIPLISMSGLAFSIIMMLVITPFTKALGKKWGIIILEAGAIVFAFALLFAPSSNVTMVVVAMMGMSFMFTGTNILTRAAVLDSANYAEWKLGVNANGLIASCFTFMNKFCQAISALIMGIILDKVGYVAQAEQQTAQTMNAILYMKTIIPIIAFIITIVAMLLYPLTKHKEQQMTNELREMREKNHTTPTEVNYQ